MFEKGTERFGFKTVEFIISGFVAARLVVYCPTFLFLQDCGGRFSNFRHILLKRTFGFVRLAEGGGGRSQASADPIFKHIHAASYKGLKNDYYYY